MSRQKNMHGKRLRYLSHSRRKILRLLLGWDANIKAKLNREEATYYIAALHDNEIFNQFLLDRGANCGAKIWGENLHQSS